MNGSHKLKAFAAANPSAPTRAETHPDEARAFDRLRELEGELFGPFCGFSGEPESQCQRDEQGICLDEIACRDDPATIHP